ncbi:hypothetical protein ABEG45_23530 [Pantoea agglomerans]|uniref:hypothetical protein n=2 Tax=Enterobacter agglomerans TaxID=549 RepID=UPI0032082540
MLPPFFSLHFHHFYYLKPFIYTDYCSGHLHRMPRRSQLFHLHTESDTLRQQKFFLSGRYLMEITEFVYSALIGLVASCRSMTPMAALAAARLAGHETSGRLLLLDRPLFKYGALAMGIGELFGDKMKSAPDRTVFLGLSARVASAGIAGAALAPNGEEKTGAVIAISAAVPLTYVTLAARKKAIAGMGQTRSGLIEDTLIVAIGAAVVFFATRPNRI